MRSPRQNPLLQYQNEWSGDCGTGLNKAWDFLVWLAGELLRTKASQGPEHLWVPPTWLHLAPKFLPLSYRIIPPRGWKRPMRYWKASSSLSSMPGSTFSAKVWRRQEWRNSPASKPSRSTHPSPVSHHRSLSGQVVHSVVSGLWAVKCASPQRKPIAVYTYLPSLHWSIRHSLH